MVHFCGRGARFLSEADVIIYADSLVNPALLDYAKEGCELHGSARMTLKQVVEGDTGGRKAGQAHRPPAHRRFQYLRRGAGTVLTG